VGKVYPSAQRLRPIQIVRVHWYGRVWCGMAISVFVFIKGKVHEYFWNENEATGARSSVVVECETVLLLSLWVKTSSITFLQKKSDLNSTILSMYCSSLSLLTDGMGLRNT
jgi:hypothetical protein